MLSFAERALGLNGRELRRAFPIFAYLFLTMASSVASKAARDALFLDRYRAIDLPYVDIAIAVLVGLAASLYIWVGHRTNLRNLQVGSLVFFALTALGLLAVGRAWPPYESGALFIVIYIWVGVFSVLAPSQVWTLANYVLTTREAKRSFGFIGSGAILGWIVGGLATRTGVSRFGTENMLGFVAVALFAVRRHRRPDLARSARATSATTRRRPGNVARSVSAVGQPAADSRVGVPEGDRRADPDRGADDDDCGLAVQGDRQGRRCRTPTSWRCSSAPST